MAKEAAIDPNPFFLCCEYSEAPTDPLLTSEGSVFPQSTWVLAEAEAVWMRSKAEIQLEGSYYSQKDEGKKNKRKEKKKP